MKTRRQCLRSSATSAVNLTERERQRETKIAAMAKTSASALLWALAAARGSALDRAVDEDGVGARRSAYRPYTWATGLRRTQRRRWTRRNASS